MHDGASETVEAVASTLGRPLRRRGPTPRLSRDQIADAVLRLGFDNLTVAAVAGELGVSPGGLYRYVTDRDDLIVAAVDRLFATIPFSPGGDWRLMLHDEAWARWNALTEHPGLIHALRSTGRRANELGRRYARCVHALADIGFDPISAILAVDTVVDLVNDGVQQSEVLRRVIAADRVESFVERQRELLGDPYADVMRDTLADPGVFFGRKLEVILTGLAVATGVQGKY